MRATFALALLLLGCDGSVDAPAPPSVEITYASLRDDGDRVRGVIVARVSAPAEGGAVTLWAGARSANPEVVACEASGDSTKVGARSLWLPPCSFPPGWFLDLPEGQERIELGPGETREVHLPVRSGNRPVYNPNRAVAECGERILVHLVPEADGARGDAYETTYQCSLAALRPRH